MCLLPSCSSIVTATVGTLLLAESRRKHDAAVDSCAAMLHVVVWVSRAFPCNSMLVVTDFLAESDGWRCIEDFQASPELEQAVLSAFEKVTQLPQLSQCSHMEIRAH